MAQREVKYESPAHKIFEGKGEYKENDVIAVAFESINHGTLHHFYTLGSVVGYAIDNCNCPFESVEKAKERGHKIHWATQNSTMVTSHDRPKEISFMQEHGDEIKFHGKTFKIVSTANDNISLEMVDEAALEADGPMRFKMSYGPDGDLRMSRKN